MNKAAKILAAALTAALVFSFSGCSGAKKTSSSGGTSAGSVKVDSSKWNYDSTNKVYWQIKVSYRASPADSSIETMGIYVPAEYMTGTKNSDGTYTCKVNTSGKVGSFTSSTAPIVFPVNTPGYASQPAPTQYSYNDISSYMKAGYIYVCAGMRGSSGMSGGTRGQQSTASSSASSSSSAVSGGAPWGVTDLKAAIRCYRYNAASLPGNSASIFTFGHSGGGAQSAITGASGDSALYTPYLKAIGAAMTDASGKTISDAICGAMCWCPVTSLDYADEAYEWNMGQYFTSGTRAASTFTSALSKDLASQFAAYINKLGLKSSGGTALTLNETSSGVYTSGTYYDYILSTIETSLNNFLSDTKFPYTASAGTTMAGMPTGGMQGGRTGSGVPSGVMPGAASGSSSSAASGQTYATAQAYIDSLNTDGKWITYDAATNKAKITSISAFVTHCKSASKSVCAFDDLSRSQAENRVFGNGSSVSYHFDAVLAGLLKANSTAYSKYSDWKASYVTDYSGDLAKTDSLSTSMATRLDMYNPMYYLSSYYQGYKTSSVAPYWRIRTGINQGDTALTTETNLSLALGQYSGVKNVDFATVWAQAHTMAERTGDSTTNFIAWVAQCLKS